MPKKSKRRKLDSVRLFSHLTGFETGAAEEETSLQDCLAELQQSLSSAPSAGTTNTTSANPIENTDSKNNKPSLTDGWEQKLVNWDRVESWNASFLSWVHGGNYPPSLLPNIDQELARHFQVQELSSFLLKKGNDLRMPVLERWLLDSRLEDSKSLDPILPISSNVRTEASQRLLKELVQNGGLNQDDAERIVTELCSKANRSGQELMSQVDRYQRSCSLKRGDRMELEDHGKSVSLVYSRRKWRKPFCFQLNRTHYEKLKDRFFEIHNQTNRKTKTITTTFTALDMTSVKVLNGFHIIILASLLRYSALSGGQLLQEMRGGGMQGAIHEQVFDVLKATFSGPWIEGFASPFNFCLPIFGSAFPDLDWHFGSMGSFMATSFGRYGGCCEANPPFSPGVMNEMVHHMEGQLEDAEYNNLPLTFVVVVPTADQDVAVVQKAATASFHRMVSSGRCRMHLRLESREHGYVEGAQHLRPTRYKRSSYDTSVIILQSRKAFDAHLDKTRFEQDLKEAFASRHQEEINQRSKDKRNLTGQVDVAI